MHGPAVGDEREVKVFEKPDDETTMVHTRSMRIEFGEPGNITSIDVVDAHPDEKCAHQLTCHISADLGLGLEAIGSDLFQTKEGEALDETARRYIDLFSARMKSGPTCIPSNRELVDDLIDEN